MLGYMSICRKQHDMHIYFFLSKKKVQTPTSCLFFCLFRRVAILSRSTYRERSFTKLIKTCGTHFSAPPFSWGKRRLRRFFQTTNLCQSYGHCSLVVPVVVLLLALLGTTPAAAATAAITFTTT